MIFLKSTAGLCNRLRALDSALLLGAATGHKVSVWWEHNVFCGAQFSDLFHPIARVRMQSREADIVTRLAFSNRRLVASARKAFGFSQWGCTLEGKLDYLFYPNRMPLDLKVVRSLSSKRIIAIRSDAGWFYPEDFSWLVPLPHLAIEIARWSSRITPVTIGIHIRRGDHTAAIARNPLSGFISAAESRAASKPDTNFFLATDDEPVRQEFTKRFPGRVWFTPAQANRATIEGISGAAIDLFCLAACAEIWGSAGSSFSETAHHLRKAPLSFPAAAPA